jgi:hypothetical protein
MILFVMMIMVVVNVMAQDAFDFGFTNTRVSQRTVTVQPTTTTRTVSATALAQASARRNNSHRTATTATQTYTTDNTQQQLAAQAQANQMQRVVSGTISNVYIMGGDLVKITISPARGTFGMRNQEFILVGYNSSIELMRGDFVTFVANYDMAYDRPAIYNNQIIDPSGMQRVYNDRLNYYGDATAMYGAYPGMTKWGNIINNVMAGAMTVASIVSLVKAIF